VVAENVQLTLGDHPPDLFQGQPSMKNLIANPGSAMSSPSAVVDSLMASLDQTHSAFFCQKPVLKKEGNGIQDGPCIAGTVSFIGEISWSLTWVLTEETAPQVAKKFTGMEFPFDSPDMVDLAGELVNVIAGEIIAQLEKRGVKSRMSLPTVVRGKLSEFLPGPSSTMGNLEYSATEGTFWFRMESADKTLVRMPGQ
jgi:CheY-specific phosphatase CheX